MHSVTTLDLDTAVERPARMPLLRRMRPRLQGSRELFVAVSPPAARAPHWAVANDHQCDGARSNHGRKRPRNRHLVREYPGQARISRSRADRGTGGECLRIGASTSEFEIIALSQWAGEHKRHGGPLSHRLHGFDGARIRSKDGQYRPAQRRWRGRYASLHAMVAG